MFATSLVLLLLGQTPLEVTSSTASPPQGALPAVAFTGSEYVVVWLDERLDALRARGMAPVTRTDLWQARVPRTGGPARSEPVCVAKSTQRAAVAADPRTGNVTVAWFEGGPPSTQLRRAQLRSGLAPVCLPASSSLVGNVNELRATWTGARTLLAWTNDTTSAVVLTWLDANGTPTTGPSALPSATPGSTSLTVGALPDAGRLAWVDNLGSVRLADVREDEVLATAGSERSIAIANGVALDQVGSVAVTQTGGTVVAQYLDGGSTSLNTALSGGRLWVVTTGARSLGVAENGGQLTAQVFDRFGDATVLSTSGETGVALATDGTDALLVTAVGFASELHTRHVPMGLTTLPPLTLEPLLLSPAELRRPSVAWVDDRWLVAFQERGPGFFGGAYLTVSPGGTTRSPISPLSAREPVILTRPSGALLLRTDTASTTATAEVTWDASTGTLLPGSMVQSTLVAPAGAATDLRTAHWTSTTLFTPSTFDGAPFQGGTPYRSFAATPGNLWIPLADGNALKTVQLTDAVLGSLLTQVPSPQRSHTGSFDRTVTPALAANWDAVDQHVLIAWVDGQGVQWEVVHAAGNTVDQGLERSMLPVFALAAAASGQHFLLAWTDATGLTVKGIRADGTTTGPWHFGATGEQAGEPVAASSPSGEVAVVWPWYSLASNAVGLRILVLDPFVATPDAGVPDAGVSDAGGADAGSPTPDGGTDGGAPDGGLTGEDAGLADGGMAVKDGGTSTDAGADPAVFETSGCACSATAAHAAWWMMLLTLGLRRRRVARLG